MSKERTKNSTTNGEAMTLLQNFVANFPEACDVPEGLDAIEGTRLLAIFDHEKANRESVFRRIPGQVTRQRMATAVEGWARFAGNKKAMAYGLDLLCYASDVIDCNKSGLPHTKALIQERARLEKVELQPEVKKVAALISVAEVSVLTYWD